MLLSLSNVCEELSFHLSIIVPFNSPKISLSQHFPAIFSWWYFFYWCNDIWSNLLPKLRNTMPNTLLQTSSSLQTKLITIIITVFFSPVCKCLHILGQESYCAPTMKRQNKPPNDGNISARNNTFFKLGFAALLMERKFNTKLTAGLVLLMAGTWWLLHWC